MFLEIFKRDLKYIKIRITMRSKIFRESNRFSKNPSVIQSFDFENQMVCKLKSVLEAKSKQKS